MTCMTCFIVKRKCVNNFIPTKTHQAHLKITNKTVKMKIIYICLEMKMH